jgi:hypothetical protein
MKRILLPFIAALVTSLGITTGLALLRRPAPTVTTQVDTAAGDSAAAAGSTVDSTKGIATDSAAAAAMSAPGSVPSSAPGVADAATKTVGASTSTATATTAPAAAPHDTTSGHAKDVARRTPASSATPQTTADSGSVTYLAKTFISMPARTAATVMLGMPDDDIAIILSGMNAKQRGAILGSFPSERATKIVRAILHDTETR